MSRALTGKPTSHRRLGLRVVSAAIVVSAVVAGVVLAANHRRDHVRASHGLAVTIVAPKPGSSVTSPVRFVFRVIGARLGAPEQALDHLHASIDGGPPAGVYEDSVVANVPPGRHTLHVELADATHESLGVTVTETFTVAQAK